MWGVSTRFQAVAGGSRALQGLPRATVLNEKAYRQSLAQGARLKFHVGWSGWTRPPAMAREGGGGQAEACLQGGVEGRGVFFKGSECPEAGCLGE